MWKVVEAQIPSKEGYRIAWVWNSLMALEDAEGRQARIEKAWLGIERCPFHEDNGPSLVVTPAKNLWHCPRWLSLKTELVDFAFAMMPLAWVRHRLNSYVRWYNTARPNGGVGLRMPEDVFRRRPPRRPMRLLRGDRFVLSVDHVDGVRSLAKYSIRRVA